jgi:hypothetical protein
MTGGKDPVKIFASPEHYLRNFRRENFIVFLYTDTDEYCFWSLAESAWRRTNLPIY